MRILCGIALVFAGCTCQPLPPGGGIAVAPDSDHKLGGGYMGAKWGMSHDQVKRIAVGKLISDQPNDFELAMGSAKLSFHFSNDQLNTVVYTPGFADETRDRQNLLQVYEGKWGGAESGPLADGAPPVFRRWRWSDGETRVDLSAQKIRGDAGERLRTIVCYQSIALGNLNENPCTGH
jgi:hypothetical protein